MLEIFEQAKGIMRSDGNFGQWTGGYPSVEVLKADMERGSSYVILDSSSEIVGTFAFIPGIEPTYNYIEGEWLTDGPYATIHRLASGPESHGIARECFDWCWSRVQNLSIDTHADNSIMQHCILKYGFTYCGVIYLANGDPRLAYQKI